MYSIFLNTIPLLLLDSSWMVTQVGLPGVLTGGAGCAHTHMRVGGGGGGDIRHTDEMTTAHYARAWRIWDAAWDTDWDRRFLVESFSSGMDNQLETRRCNAHDHSELRGNPDKNYS